MNINNIIKRIDGIDKNRECISTDKTILDIDNIEFNFGKEYIIVDHDYSEVIPMPEENITYNIYRKIKERVINTKLHEHDDLIYKIKRHIKLGEDIEKLKKEVNKRNITLDFVTDRDLEYIVKDIRNNTMEDMINAAIELENTLINNIIDEDDDEEDDGDFY